MNLLLLLNGSGAKIMRAHRLPPNETDAIKIDEKIFASPKALFRLIRAKPYRAIYFGCDRLSDHRFAFFQKCFIGASTRRGGIVDEVGAKSSYSSLKLLLVETPLFAWEAFVSLLVVVWFHVQILFDKRALRAARR